MVKKTKIKRVRSDTLGYVQRSFLGCVSEVDQFEAREVGEKAAQYAIWHSKDGSVAIRRTGDYSVDYFLTPLETVAAEMIEYDVNRLPVVDAGVADDALNLLGVDRFGLDDMDLEVGGRLLILMDAVEFPGRVICLIRPSEVRDDHPGELGLEVARVEDAVAELPLHLLELVGVMCGQQAEVRHDGLIGDAHHLAVHILRR